MLEKILFAVQALAAQWQEMLGNDVQVVLGGSLISGMFILDEQTEVIDIDVRFLVNDPATPGIIQRIEQATGLTYRKTISVGDFPEGTSQGHMVEGFITLPDVTLPVEVEGCIRNRAYVGWAKYWPVVLTEVELAEVRRRKQELRGDKKAYKAYKEQIRQLVVRRVIDRGLL